MSFTMGCVAGWAALLALWAGPMVDGHVHKAPHGGLIAHSGKHHLELVVKDRHIEVWVLDQEERAVTLPTSAHATLLLPPRRIGVRGADGTLRIETVPSTSVSLSWVKDHFETPFELHSIVSEGMRTKATVVWGETRLEAPFTWTRLDATHRLDDRVEGAPEPRPRGTKPPTGRQRRPER